MRNFAFENQGTNTYLVYTVSPEDNIDTMSLGMLTNNSIMGLAPALFTQMDTCKYIKFNVSSHISVKQFFAGQVNKKRLIGVFKGIVNALLSAEDYMIDVNSILLDFDYIFADVSTCDAILICLPIISDDLSNKDLGAFFKNIMFTTQFDQTENCDHVAKIINYLNSSPVFSLADFKKLLNNIEGDSATVQIQQPVVQKQPVQQLKVPVQQSVQQSHPVQQLNQQQSVAQLPVNQPKVQTPPAQQQVQQEKPEKKISMFGLMMHYSKENAALYKQQKAAKKSSQPQSVANSLPQPKKQHPQTGFAIPGQVASPTKQDFAVPGQQQYSVPKNIPQSTQTPEQHRLANSAQQTGNSQPVYTPPQIPKGQSMNFGETTVLGGGGGIGETTVLGATPVTQVKPHLIRAKNNEKIDLNKPVFRIGKEKSYVDYFIGDNSAISRSHANIISRDGEYFVVDTNSTNHTYVNGQMIQSNVETKIAHGAKLRLANEDFEFKLY